MKTVGYYVDYDETEPEEAVVVTTESTTPAQSIDQYTIFTENVTNTDGSYGSTVVIEEETSTQSDDEKERDEPESSTDDIIELNVGGQKITTFRSTLTAVRKSKLALMFTKGNKNETQLKSKQDSVYFFDYNPIQFQYLLDQLRAVKRTPEIPAYELNFVEPNVDVRFNFSDMLFELGLNPDYFLSPLVGAHINLQVDSLIGWKQCYRSNYNTPFDTTVLTNICNGKRLLVACRSNNDKNTLIVAGVGKRKDIFHPCTAYSQCTTAMENGTGFYYVQNQAWGFEGRPKGFIPNYNTYNYHFHGRTPQGSFYVNPCDSSDEHSEYRLCWSISSNIGRGGGDRCGSSKNLHNTAEWERVIYHII